MSVLPKKSYTGILKKKLLNKGSKSEHEAIVLEQADGSYFRLRIHGQNPFQNDALKAHIGKRVVVNAIATPAQPLLIIDSMADIVILGPPGKPAKPPRP